MATEQTAPQNSIPEAAPAATAATTAPPLQAAASTPAAAETASPTIAVEAVAASPQPAAPVAAAQEVKAGHCGESPRGGRPALMAAAASRSRFPLLAASIAVAAAFGSIVGAGAFTAASQFLVTPPPPAAKADPAEDGKELQARIAQLRASVKALADSVTALRTTAEASGKGNTAQLAKVSEQLGKLAEAVERSERAQAEPAARLSKAAEALERFDKRAHAQPAPETTGSVPAARAEPPKPAIVQGWLLRQVVDGVALLEGQDRVIEVEAGDNIRGVGRVEDIRRQDGRWVVVTSKGLIVARR